MWKQCGDAFPDGRGLLRKSALGHHDVRPPPQHRSGITDCDPRGRRGDAGRHGQRLIEGARRATREERKPIELLRDGGAKRRQRRPRRVELIGKPLDIEIRSGASRAANTHQIEDVCLDLDIALGQCEALLSIAQTNVRLRDFGAETDLHIGETRP